MTHGQNDIHALVDIGHQSVRGVFTEVADEFAEGWEVVFVVEDVWVGEDGLCAVS